MNSIFTFFSCEVVSYPYDSQVLPPYIKKQKKVCLAYTSCSILGQLIGILLIKCMETQQEVWKRDIERTITDKKKIPEEMLDKMRECCSLSAEMMWHLSIKWHIGRNQEKEAESCSGRVWNWILRIWEELFWGDPPGEIVPTDKISTKWFPSCLHKLLKHQ